MAFRETGCTRSGLFVDLAAIQRLDVSCVVALEHVDALDLFRSRLDDLFDD